MRSGKMSQFHKKPVTHINHVAIKVTDLKQSITFYKEVLGLNVLTDDGNNVQLSANNIDPLITLVQIKNPTKKHTKTTGLYHFAILLPTRDDLAQFLQH